MIIYSLCIIKSVSLLFFFSFLCSYKFNRRLIVINGCIFYFPDNFAVHCILIEKIQYKTQNTTHFYLFSFS
ncbi:uncharacterized protein BX663DRAFT_496355 [Cokeromyces recurvatus]|uniref:uncharacterized protein n=1 Tax=Cokeromyces recurvatus TaxID=90255 RepID=UPI00221F9F0C|nr:uncharacterized protein BX663DRAFT_496355 [Cokeromyces recurvatus]KAI7906420.1 hypothetical protein BX663DRAFT_496355 [Cokeromyces recurvatus]